jgi:hypothetical protein
VDTLYKTGPLSNRINVVILGDGFTKEELPKFTAEAKSSRTFSCLMSPIIGTRIISISFLSPRLPRKVVLPIPEQLLMRIQISRSGKRILFTAVLSGRPFTGWSPLITRLRQGVLASNLPEFDLTVVLVNTTFYGGSGGAVAVHTLHGQANLIGVHEIGHTFSQLNDEYWAGSGYGWEAPNMTMDGNPATIKWKNWLNSNGIGIHKHQGDGDAASWHKPTQGACLMEFLNQQFCAVCKEATTEKILSLVMPVEKLEPDAEGTVMLDGPKTFKLNLINPVPNTMQVDLDAGWRERYWSAQPK